MAETDTLSQVEAIVDGARGKPDELALIRAGIAAMPGHDAGDGTHWDHEVAIGVGMGRRFDHELEALGRIRELELSVAPHVAGMFTTDRSQVIVRRYWACKGERLLKANEEPVKLSAPASGKFREDLVRLADAGFMHAAAFRGMTYWLVGERTGTIVLDGWAALQPLRDREAMFEAIDASLSRNS